MTARWENWARTERATPDRTVSPSSTEEVATVVTAAAAAGSSVKAVGSGHSFSGIAVAEGVQLRPDRLTGVVRADTGSGLVTVRAGMPLHRLNPLLAELGLALEIVGDIDRQTVAGALTTGTHGSGGRFGIMATQVRELELVLADGSVVTCSAVERPDLFAAARVSLGALGVITTVTLQCVPLFALRGVDRPQPLQETLESLDDLVAAHDHFEFFWFPHTTTALTRRFTRLPAGSRMRPRSRPARTVEDRFLADHAFERLLRLGARRPGLVPGITRLATRLTGSRDVTDLAHRVFVSPRNVRFREGEYAVPRDAVVDALSELRRWVDTHDEAVSFPFEVRFAAADDIWLSPAHERDVAYVAFHQYHRMPHDRWFRVCEDVLGAAGGRPHWGKMHRLGAAELAGLYPRFADFTALRADVDPSGVFANPYLDRVLGSAGAVR
ncbi:FAD-binding protein [Streptomyces sp. NBC_01754]|uniref:D-arabinono-1,4-lactone oxidase n=1 Tax=Streptomyces sp. NBC_01754 TaxID=2975930 RepID=UPI002DDA50A9|nr:D-arabinono-1,4-lactone oxidase [Streptomyces sp. NBC_01754]WSC95418.1 FAD-binding protein [Streptomyces sp. NBC_01754]